MIRHTSSITFQNLISTLILGYPIALLGIVASIHPAQLVEWVVLSTLLLGVSVLVYVKFFRDRITVLSQKNDFEDSLDELAQDHQGTISWITKSSIWAYEPKDFDERLRNKIKGLQSDRLTQMRYILHLGYWRTLIQEASESKERLERAAMYKLRLSNLIGHLENEKDCPVDKVQFVIGETTAVTTPYRFGVYMPDHGAATVFLVFDETQSAQSNPIPRLKVRSAQMASFFQDMFDRQWSQYRAAMFADEDQIDDNKLRKKVLDHLRRELDWVKSRYFPVGSHLLAKRELIDSAIKIFESTGEVTITAPQKVCLSGDYCDMVENGQVLSLAISTRGQARIQRSNRAFEVSIEHQKDAESPVFSNWALVDEFKKRMDQLGAQVKVTLYPSDAIGIGLGSSGSGAILIAACEAIIRKQSTSIEKLIGNAHSLENGAANWSCGSQDHAIAALGGLRKLKFHYPDPRFEMETVRHDPLMLQWLSIWRNSQMRPAHPVIQDIHKRMNGEFILRKNNLVEEAAQAIIKGNGTSLINTLRKEAQVQKEMGMLTVEQMTAIAFVEEKGGGAKVSGAGGGGVLVVCMEPIGQVEGLLSHLGFTRRPFDLADNGLAIRD